MTDAPAVSALTRRWYDSLPELYTHADELEPSGGGYPLLRYLSLLGDQAGAVEALGDRVDGGELTDPYRADPGWLDWLGQFVGVRVPGGTPDAVKRDLIDGGSAGWQAGTRGSIAVAAKRHLSGTQYATVAPSTTDRWTIRVVVRADEAPTPLSLVADAIVEDGAKPAGFVLEVIAYTPTWDNIDGLGGTWADHQQSTWSQVDASGATA